MQTHVGLDQERDIVMKTETLDLEILTQNET